MISPHYVQVLKECKYSNAQYNTEAYVAASTVLLLFKFECI